MAKHKKRKGKSKKKRGFSYQTRSKESWEKRAEQSGYSKRSMFIEGVKLFRPKDDDNLIRILPPTYEDADHYGLEIYVHYNIGADRDAFLCLNKMQDEPCPVCEERQEALSDNDKEYADKLNPKKRVLTYVVNRDDEDAGALLWSMAWTLDADITTLAVDKRTGEVLDVDNPEDGYDVEFTRTGKGVSTKYTGVAIARKRSDLDHDEALAQVVELPLDETLKYYEYDEIHKIFNGGATQREDEEKDDDDEVERGRKKKDKKGKGKDKKKKRAKKEKQEVTWKEVQNMDLDELEELVEDEELDVSTDIDEEDDDEFEELRNEVCEELGLKKPKKRKPKKGEKTKLRKRGKRK